MIRLAGLLPLALAACAPSLVAQEPTTPRAPRSETELRGWLENMVWYHHFSIDEIVAATGIERAAITSALAKFDIRAETRPKRPTDSPLLVLPYPGGRHPRIGFLDGAVDPQRETKLSVFTPWDADSYVVVDLPEAIWSNLGLTYLAHTHVGTIWTKQGVSLERLEWERTPTGGLHGRRVLPNGIAFEARATPSQSGVDMELSLTNGTQSMLTDLRVQVCVMLKGAKGFTAQTNDNKVIKSPYVAVKSDAGHRWIITRWDPIERAWANPPCPCLHADPKFPDCAPGETVRVRGRLWFFEGEDIESQLAVPE